MTQMYLLDDSTQYFLNVHMSLKWWTWVQNDEENI